MIDGENNQLGVLPREEALEKARAANLDLVEVAPQADPPVARIMDFGKFQYEQKKQAKQQKKQRAGLVKEIRLSMKIGAHDLDYRLEKAKKFLADGQKVKFNLMMKGRENANPKAAMQRVKDIAAQHVPEAEPEADPVRAGRSISMVVAPPKGGFKDDDAKKDGSEEPDGKATAKKAEKPEAPAEADARSDES